MVQDNLAAAVARRRNCAIYTRKSVDAGLEREFNTLESQREMCANYIRSNCCDGWFELPTAYDDGGYSGGTLARPALQRLIADIEQGLIDVVVIYKIDRLTRSLADFVRLIELFDRYQVTFVSVTQAFDTADSMGRLVLNILLTFAQFEREMHSDRVRDKIAAMKRRGHWTGGPPPFGYDVVDGKLVINVVEAATVLAMFERYVELGCYKQLVAELQAAGLKSKEWTTRQGVVAGGGPVSRGMIWGMLASRWYVGDVPHLRDSFPGIHQAVVPRELWDRAQAIREDRRTVKPIPEPSPNVLLGLLHDGDGRRMVIDCSAKKGTNYRYYVSAQSRRAARHGLKRLRVSAGPLEALVVSGLQTLLSDHSALTAAVATLGRWNGDIEAQIDAGPVAARRLGGLDERRLRLGLEALLARVEVSRDDVKMMVRTSELVRFLGWSGSSIFRRGPRIPGELVDRIHIVTMPSAGTRIERRFSLPIAAANADRNSRPLPGLIDLLKSAHRAQAAVFADRGASPAELARRFNRTPSYFARLLRLNYLAPDIATAIFDGCQPNGLTRRRLIFADLPTDWRQQRILFGFHEQPTSQSNEERY
ncbi:recombinase family protein [Sphingomonas bacterium]|uniref:recombinase family protein n=1 Tax=Sphingomonas bacterium TaxID=1895847 RepID=UPI001575733B|nr:recombinase family protein [Sphingomonas bacterium]